MQILVVDDDWKVASFLERGLQGDGYAMDLSHNGADGSRNAHVYDYDLLVLDVMLPGKTGLEIVREQRAAPVLCFSARDSKVGHRARAG